MTRQPKIYRRPPLVWFENYLGLISVGNILGGDIGDCKLNVVRCDRTGKEFHDVANWQTRQQYENLDRGNKLSRNRHGSLSKSGSQRG